MKLKKETLIGGKTFPIPLWKKKKKLSYGGEATENMNFAKALLLNMVYRQDKVSLIDTFHYWDQLYSDKVGHVYIQQHPTDSFSIEVRTLSTDKAILHTLYNNYMHM